MCVCMHGKYLHSMCFAAIHTLKHSCTLCYLVVSSEESPTIYKYSLVLAAMQVEYIYTTP